MAEVIPPIFLFRFTFPCRYRSFEPRAQTERLLDLQAEYTLPHLGELNRQKTFAEVRVAWNEEGLGIQVVVQGKDRPPLGDAQRPRSSGWTACLGEHSWGSTNSPSRSLLPLFLLLAERWR
jgi:hypothetical protein